MKPAPHRRKRGTNKVRQKQILQMQIERRQTEYLGDLRLIHADRRANDRLLSKCLNKKIIPKRTAHRRRPRLHVGSSRGAGFCGVCHTAVMFYSMLITG